MIKHDILSCIWDYHFTLITAIHEHVIFHPYFRNLRVDDYQLLIVYIYKRFQIIFDIFCIFQLYKWLSDCDRCLGVCYTTRPGNLTEKSLPKLYTTHGQSVWL